MSEGFIECIHPPLASDWSPEFLSLICIVANLLYFSGAMLYGTKAALCVKIIQAETYLDSRAFKRTVAACKYKAKPVYYPIHCFPYGLFFCVCNVMDSILSAVSWLYISVNIVLVFFNVSILYVAIRSWLIISFRVYQGFNKGAVLKSLKLFIKPFKMFKVLLTRCQRKFTALERLKMQ